MDCERLNYDGAQVLNRWVLIVVPSGLYSPDKMLIFQYTDFLCLRDSNDDASIFYSNDGIFHFGVGNG